MSTPQTPSSPALEPARDEQIDWTERFSDYYDGEMSAPEREAFEAWLEADPAARAEYETFSSSLEMLHGLDFNTAPRSFVQDVTQDINRQSRGAFFSNESWWLGFRVPYEVFAAVGIAIFAALYLFGVGARGDYQVVDAEPGADVPGASQDHPASDAEVSSRSGTPHQAAGATARVVVLSVAGDTDLSALSRSLRADGFATRPAMRDGAQAVVISVPVGQLERFGERVFVATGVDHGPSLRAAARGASSRAQGPHAVTVELVAAR